MTAEVIAQALGGRRAGSAWMARCPAHDDRVPSLAIDERSDGTVLVCCHAGCSQHAVINALTARGLWPGVSGRSLAQVPVPPRQRTDREPPPSRTRVGAAMSIWHRSEPAAGTLVETYLRTRGITLPPPRVLAYQSRLTHPTGGVWPGMVALVTRGRDDDAVGIHRTFVTRDGRAKAAVSPQRMMLGPCRGGAVRLAAATDVVLIGEGIETCLAVMQATGRPVWAALSTAGLRSLDLPEYIRNVVVLADADLPGEAAALEAGRRWRHQGRGVRVARPPTGLDFNDLLLGRNPRDQEVTA